VLGLRRLYKPRCYSLMVEQNQNLLKAQTEFQMPQTTRNGYLEEMKEDTATLTKQQIMGIGTAELRLEC